MLCLNEFIKHFLILWCHPNHVTQTFGVWVDAGDMPALGSTLVREHARMGPEGFAERQRRCRDVWERHLSASGFFKTLRDWLTNAIA
jgi:hypothetical protein